MTKRKDPKVLVGSERCEELPVQAQSVEVGAPAAEAVEVQHRTGRPSELNQGAADAICEHLEEGKSLRSFCEQEGNPNKSTVLRWLRNDPGFRAQYADARARGMDTMADELIEIADESGLDVVGVNEKTGQPMVDGEAIARARLRFDARRWLMSKLAPKKYGDKVEVEQTGEVKHTITFRRG